MRRVVAASFFIMLTACVGPKPCGSGGDVTWEPPVKGDRECLQRRDKSGKWFNHGKFIQYDENHKVIVEGMFKEGEKDGVWVQYSPEGKKLKEKYFEAGVEKAYVPKPEPEDEPRRVRLGEDEPRRVRSSEEPVVSSQAAPDALVDTLRQDESAR